MDFRLDNDGRAREHLSIRPLFRRATRAPASSSPSSSLPPALRDVPAQALLQPHRRRRVRARHRVVAPVLAAGDGEDTGRILRDARPLRIGPARRRTRREGWRARQPAQRPSRRAPRVAERRTRRRGPRLAGPRRRRRVRRRHRRGHAGQPEGVREASALRLPGRELEGALRARARGGRREVRVRGRRRRRRTLQRYRPDRLARSPSARGGGF